MLTEPPQLESESDAVYELDDTGAFNAANEHLTRDTDSNSSVNYTLGHDAVGNMTDDGKDYTYVYDVFGRLVKVKARGSGNTVAEYAYDGLGQRISYHADEDAGARWEPARPRRQAARQAPCAHRVESAREADPDAGYHGLLSRYTDLGLYRGFESPPPLSLDFKTVRAIPLPAARPSVLAASPGGRSRTSAAGTREAPLTQRFEAHLEADLARVCAARSLLVASDYDGTLAAFTVDPAAARPIEPSLAALEALAAVTETYVAIISGRGLDDLARLCGRRSGVTLIGSHGAEDDAARDPSPRESALLADLGAALEGIAAGAPGLRVEPKPLGVVLHWRGADAEAGERARRAALEGPARRPGVHAREGSMVLELCVREADKGAALRRLRSRLGADAVVFIGDDVTDEDAFAALSAGDLGIKVGPGPTAAGRRVPGVEAVTGVLERLLALRREFVG